MESKDDDIATLRSNHRATFSKARKAGFSKEMSRTSVTRPAIFIKIGQAVPKTGQWRK
jgi:hypothetical protein